MKKIKCPYCKATFKDKSKVVVNGLLINHLHEKHNITTDLQSILLLTKEIEK